MELRLRLTFTATIKLRSHSVQLRADFPENRKHVWLGGRVFVPTGVGDVDIMGRSTKVKKGTHRVMFSRGEATASKGTVLFVPCDLAV